MDDDVLSEEEVESLLSAVDPEPENPPPPETNKVQTPEVSAKRSHEKVSPYDFKRPERVGKDQMRALQFLHEGFGRSFGASMSALLRTIIEVRLTSVDQLTYSEFVFSLENPTCFNLLSAHPLDGNIILDLNPSILYPIIDRLLGGGKDDDSPSRRPLTEIELLLVSRITSIFTQELEKAWENVLELELAVERVESNPQLVQVVPPNEVVVLISFELTLGKTRGMMNLCIPFNSIERISSKLAANSWVGYSRSGSTPESIETITQRLDGSRVQLVVTLAESTVSTADLIGLRVGDVITTEKDVHSPLRVEIQGIEKFGASPGTFKGKTAIQVLDTIEPRRRTAAN
ncbi:MAG: flagellar motor switch protein FliM [Pirellulaceae bacterium]|jgi:flagellar motor switch protein FliM|nr:flagellar motor switch protein FliM [Pirellulaceae bacterium]